MASGFHIKRLLTGKKPCKIRRSVTLCQTIYIILSLRSTGVPLHIHFSKDSVISIQYFDKHLLSRRELVIYLSH